MSNREQRRSEAKASRTVSPVVISKAAQQASMETCTDTVEIEGKTLRKVGVGFAAFKAYYDEKCQHHHKTGKFREAKFSCGDCKACCHQRVEILGIEPTSRLEHLDIVDDEFGGRSLRRNADGSCVHLGEHGCSVYEHRPTACRAYDCRVYSFLGINLDHQEFGGKEPTWQFDTTTKENQIVAASLELLSESYQGPIPTSAEQIGNFISDKKSRLESAITAMRGQFDRYETRMASMTPYEREEFEVRMRAELIGYEESRSI